MKQNFVDIHLDIEKREDKLLAHVLFSNNTDGDIHLDAQTICKDNTTRRSVFNIMDENDNKVDYIGVYVNRDVVPEDFIELKAGEKVETRIELSKVYEINKGHKYSIQYSVFHPTYRDNAGFTLFESNRVEVNY